MRSTLATSMFSLSLSVLFGVAGAFGCGTSGAKLHSDGGGNGGVGDAGFGADNPDFDIDGDGFTPNQGDCNDHDATIYPGAPELCDGKDHSCSGVVDGPCDHDGDGYTAIGTGSGDDKDCNDADALVNPGAFEVMGNGVDDDCDGEIDEMEPTCDTNPKQNDPMSFAGAIEICAPWAVSKGTSFNTNSDVSQRKVLLKYGKTYKPKAGKSFIVMSSGIAADEGGVGYIDPQPGTEFSNQDQMNPLPMNAKNNVCGNAAKDELMVHDYVELKLQLKVPTNALSFSFNFNFLSAEYPEWVGSEFNDKFLAILDSKAFKGNICFDKNKNPITINVGFFDACDSASICNGQKTNTCSMGKVTELNGTGYELDDGSGQKQGGGTGWLTTTAPVRPGETATLRFIVFDEGDHILDSAVIIDNFQWQLKASDGPITIQ